MSMHACSHATCTQVAGGGSGLGFLGSGFAGLESGFFSGWAAVDFASFDWAQAPIVNMPPMRASEAHMLKDHRRRE